MSLDMAVKQAVDDINRDASEMYDKAQSDERTMEAHARSTAEDIPWFRIDRHFMMWLRDTLKQLWDKFTRFLEEVAKLVTWISEKILQWIASPAYIAASWVKWQKVAEDVSMTQGKMDLNHVPGAIEWKGVAASAYQQTAKEQVTAGEATVTLIQALQGLLQAHLTSMLDFLLKLLSSMTTVTVSVTESAAKFIKIENPLEWGDIVDGLIGVVTTGLEELGKIRNSILEYLREHLVEMGEVQQKALVAYSLPGGNMWPDPSPNVNPVGHPGKPWTHD